MKINWDEWRGSIDGRPSMFIKRLASWRGYVIDLHKFVRADDPECFHTHPATALRIILWGGYVEEIDNADLGRDLRQWCIGMMGFVRPELCHRIDRLLNGRYSVSLWLRGPKTDAIEIRGAC